MDLDFRGQSCPIPALKMRETIEKADSDRFVVYVDCGAAFENVTRLLTKRGYQCQSDNIGDSVKITADRVSGRA